MKPSPLPRPDLSLRELLEAYDRMRQALEYIEAEGRAPRASADAKRLGEAARIGLGEDR